MVSGSKAADVRFIGPLVGRYALASRARRGGLQILACRLQSISCHQLIASAPVLGLVDEGITVHFNPFGPVRGTIRRHVEGGFVVAIDADADERQKLAARIDWYKKRTFAGLPDKRAHRRFMPREPRSALILASGVVLPCLVIDLSASGAAVSADVDPPIGEPLAVGRVVGRVVRKLDVGFAIRFVDPIDAGLVEDMLKAPHEWQRAMEIQEAAASAEIAASIEAMQGGADPRAARGDDLDRSGYSI
ncbi:MAG TPA: PilZ domain-containing protein [Devosia sp.]|nr:PilZ domain-containing protein [Devosia sp.]